MDNVERKFFRKVWEQLASMGYDLDNLNADRSGANSCFMRGDFAGYSVASLLQYFASKTNSKIKWTGENWN